VKQRENQSKRILRLLRENVNQWVALPRILDLRISQYSSRVWTLRRQGHEIQNRVQRHGDETWSWFRLVEQGQVQLFEPPQSEESRRHHVLEADLKHF
jgi:hypothetical protein